MIVPQPSEVSGADVMHTASVSECASAGMGLLAVLVFVRRRPEREQTFPSKIS